MNADRRLELALRAFPRRFRAARSDEIRATVADARAAGDDGVDSWRGLLDIVLAGWAERRRTRPPLGPYLRYRVFETRLASQWHPWMLDDVRGLYPLRAGAGVAALLLVMARAMETVFDLFVGEADSVAVSFTSWPGLALGCSVVAAGEACFHVRRSSILRRHGYDPRTGRPFAMMPVWAHLRARVLRPAAPALSGVGWGLLVVAPFAGLALFAPVWLSEVAFGSFTIGRSADHRVLIGFVALGVAVLAATASRSGARALMRRYSTVSPVFVPGQWVHRRSDREVWWYAFVLVAVPGVASAVLPITPFILPAVFLAAVGAAPGLLLAAAQLRRAEVETGRPAWLRLANTDRALAQLGGRPLP